MPYGDGIPKINCFSLTDFNEYNLCPFRFFVKHHLDKKYELEKGSEITALGNILDLSIKFFHKAGAYGQPKEYLGNIVNRAVFEIRDKVAREPNKKSFYSASVPFINDKLIQKATKIFQDYYQGLGGKIKRSIGEVGFCEYVISDGSDQWKLWGGPDAFEMGEDGIPEICDYKYSDKDKAWDMDLMPKVYTLLSARALIDKGYFRTRFILRLWTDPGNDSFYEEFDLNKISEMAPFFQNKIQTILSTKEVGVCEKSWCSACQIQTRAEFIRQLSEMGYQVLSRELLKEPHSGKLAV